MRTRAALTRAAFTRAALAGGMLAILLASAAGAEECGAVGAPKNISEFLGASFAGQVAWKADGENATRAHVLNHCTTIYLKHPSVIYFVANNYYKALSGDGAASYVAIQVARLQKQTQSELEATIQRNDGWTSDGKTAAPGFNSQAIDGVDAKAFFALHRASPFNPATLQYDGVPWHGVPANGKAASSRRPVQFAWDSVDLFERFPDRALLSNRLYAFKFNPAGNTGIPFDAGVLETEELRIRIFSPLWSQDNFEYVVRFAN
jgi:hypothetical protein